MKNHLILLFAAERFRKTIILFVVAALFIIISSLVGISDNLPMIAMLLAGIILLFFAVLHPWKKASNYWFLILVSFVILVLEGLAIFILAKMHLDRYISEGIVMGVTFIICLPGILVGIIGGIICAVRKKPSVPTIKPSCEDGLSINYFIICFYETFNAINFLSCYNDRFECSN